jgi:hypothetical protein
VRALRDGIGDGNRIAAAVKAPITAVVTDIKKL